MKNQILQFLEFIGVPLTYICTAFAGALLSASQERKDRKISTRYMLLRLLTGFSVSVWITPIIVKYFGLDINYGYGCSFLLGNTGAILLDILRNTIESNGEFVKNLIQEYIKSWFDKLKPK